MEKKQINQNVKQFFKGKNEIYVITFILTLLIFIFSLISKHFLSPYNIVSLGQSFAPYAFLSLGVLFVVATGGTDLSCGTVCIGSIVFAGALVNLGMPFFLVIPAMILFGALIGLINGLLIAKLKISPFIVTLGTMMAARGITAIFANVPNIFFPSSTWYNYVFSSYNGVPTGVIWAIVFTIIVFVFINKHKLGRYILAIGSNEEATKLSGINTDFYKILAYVISGAFAGIAGIFYSSSFATIAVATGNGMELDALAGVFIGGTSVAGGTANVIGSVLGAFLLVVIRSGLNFTMATYNVSINSTYVTYVLAGTIIIVAVLLDVLKKKKESDSKQFERNKINSSNSNNKFRNFFKNNIKSISVLTSAAVLVSLIVYNTVNYARSKREENKVVCVITKSLGNGFWDTVKMGALDCGRQYGYEVYVMGTESESPSYLSKQREIYTTMLSKNPVGLGLACIADGFVDLLEATYEQNIPVFTYDSGLWPNDQQRISNSKKNPIVSSIFTDPHKLGEIAADNFYRECFEEIEANSNYPIGIIQYDNNETAANRANGFKEHLEELVNQNPTTSGHLTWYMEIKPNADNQAYKAALEALTLKGIKACFMTNETIVNQVNDAITSGSGQYNDIVFCGLDSGTKQIEWMKNDNMPKLIGAVSQNPHELGYRLTEEIINYHKNRVTEDSYEILGCWYYKEDVDEKVESGIAYFG